MALNHSPKIVTDGLVFAYDMGNSQKSWKGAPTTNLYGDFSTSSALRTNTQHFTNGAGWVTSGYADPGAPSPGFYLGKVYKFVSGSINSTWSGNSYGYMYKDIASTNGQAYTMSFWAYVSPDCNITALPASVETTTGYAAANLPGTYDLTKKGTWQRIGASSTGVGTTTRWLAYPQRTGVTDGSFSGYFLIAGMQVETGTFATPYTDNTRSNTQALIDLTGMNTITASSLTYASDGTFSFNGSSNKMTNVVSAAFVPSTNTIGRSWEVVVKPGASMTAAGIFGHVLGAGCTYFCNGGICIESGQYKFNWYDNAAYQFLASGVTATNGQYAHIIGTFDPSDLKMRIYVNGTLMGTSAATNLNYGNAANEYQIGYLSASGNSYTGKIDVCRYYYNKTLSAAEVKQNFNALRGRYGI